MNDDPAERAVPSPSNGDLQGLQAFIKQALINTSKAFVAPTVVGALLPAPYRSLAFVPAGAALSHQRLHPGPQRFDPALSRDENLVAAGIGFSPFLLLLPLHAKFAHLDNAMGQKIRSVWVRATGILRGPLGRWLQQYPVNFVFVRATAQLGASALGASMAFSHVTATSGSRYCVTNHAPNHQPTNQKTAQAMAAGAAFFTVPAALGMPQIRSRVPGLRHMGPIGTTAFVTASLIAAALGTIVHVHPSPNESVTSD